MMFAQKDFEIDEVLCKPLMAHLSTVEKGAPRDSPVWFLWEGSGLWVFGTSEDSFVKRLRAEPKCAAGIVEYDLEKGILKHVGIRGTAAFAELDKARLMRFVSKYLGEDRQNWNPWFIANVVDPLDAMIEIMPESIVAKNVSFLKRGLALLPRNPYMEKLKENITKIYGSKGESWIAGLHRSVDQLKTVWGLSNLKPLSNLSYSYVLEGFQGESPIVLKLSPDADLTEKEARTLDAFKGFGAVAVLGHKNGALLLERAVPGTLLKNSLLKENRIEIACKVMERLHQASLPSKGLFPHIEEWLAAVDKEWDLPKEHLERARKLKKNLLKNKSPSEILLHGDLHQENILSHGNGWVVIDPKGVIGCPIHEVWACVEDPLRDLKFLSGYFGYPFQDIAEWYYVRLILAACWQAEDGLDAGRFLALAESVLPMVEP